MVAGEDIGCDEDTVFVAGSGVGVGGSFEAKGYKQLRERWMFAAIIGEYFEVALDMIMNVFDVE